VYTGDLLAVNAEYVEELDLERLRVRFFPRACGFVLPVVSECGDSCFDLVPE